MVHAIYNYLAADYMQQVPYVSNTTHKRSELRSIYNAIIKTSKKSPLYKVDLTKENQTYALSIKDLSLAIFDLLKPLYSDNKDSVFHSFLADSSDPDTISASLATEDKETLPEPFSIKVNQLAQGQINTSTAVPIDAFGPAPGNYSFTASLDNNVYEFQYKIKENTTNKDTLNKLSHFINKSGIGIKSSIVYPDNDTIQIVMHSEDTGTTGDAIFNFTDTKVPEGAQGLTAYYGLNQITTPPKNAEFVLNGETKEALSNRILFNKALQIDLLKPSDHEVSVAYKPDIDNILPYLRDFKTQYNRIVECASTYESSQGMPQKLLRMLKLAALPNKNDLESSGICFNENGQMEIDESLASQAIESSEMNRLFSSTGYVGRIKKQLYSIIINPMEFVNKTLVTYPNITKPGVASSYVTSIYSGMLFNYYC